MTDADATYEVNVREKTFDSNKVLIFVTVLEILPRDLHFIKFEESKFAELMSIKL